MEDKKEKYTKKIKPYINPFKELYHETKYNFRNENITHN